MTRGNLEIPRRVTLEPVEDIANEMGLGSDPAAAHVDIDADGQTVGPF
jgi:hypothetical protein